MPRVENIRNLSSDLPISPPALCSLTQSAHLAMIDALMMAYTVEMASAEKVMNCIRQYSCGSAEEETPYDTEDAVTTWINAVRGGVFPLNF